MKVKVTQDTTWNRALNAARRTAGKPMLDKEPSESWRKMALMAEHSPIKLVEYTIMFEDVRQWVGVHLLRHEHTLPYIHTQRADRRDYLLQGQPNDQDFVVNAQTLINISRKRLCSCASKETREAWHAVKAAIAEIDPVMAAFMVPNCIYRGFCPEKDSCGYWTGKRFERELNEYRNLIGRGKNV